MLVRARVSLQMLLYDTQYCSLPLTILCVIFPFLLQVAPVLACGLADPREEFAGANCPAALGNDASGTNK